MPQHVFLERSRTIHINRNFLRNVTSERASVRTFSLKIEPPVRDSGAPSSDLIRNATDVKKKNCAFRRQRSADSRRDIAAERDIANDRGIGSRYYTSRAESREFPPDSRWTGNDLPMSQRINRRTPPLPPPPPPRSRLSLGVHLANDHSVIPRLCSTLRPSRTMGTLLQASSISFP